MNILRISVLCVAIAGSLWATGYTGSVTSAGCGPTGISGWATYGTNQINVDLYSDTVYMGTYPATGYSGSNGTGNSGFAIPVPPALQDDQVHAITVRYGGTETNILVGTSSTQSSSTIQCQPSWAGYQYYFVDPFQSISGTNWIKNGTFSAITGAGLNAQSSGGGSLISNTTNVPVPGPNSNNYEVSSDLVLQGNGGAYVQYLRASTNALSSGATGQGSYLSVELQNPQFDVNSGACAATLTAYQATSGAVTPLMSTSVACHSRMTIRSVVFGSSANIMVNGVVYNVTGVNTTTGYPGVGGRSMPSSNSIGLAQLGQWDNTAPSAVNANTFTSTVYFNGTPGSAGSVMAQWQGAPDGNGVGVAYYTINRTTYLGTDPNSPVFTSYDASFYDGTVLTQNTYTYTVWAYDFHGNGSPASSFLATTGQGTVDGRRIGIHPTGSYWGGAGEQIDLLSGNLNYSLPLITAMGRAGLKATFALVYNSQNWRFVISQDRLLGTDTGYGFGWQLMLGSVMPIYTGNGVVAYYLFTDSTGAQYHLSQQQSGVWTSAESEYVWYDANQNRLYFRNGTFWVMGCISAGGEQDAGTLYPTVIEDTNGNQIIVTYAAGSGVSWANSSSRISGIEDARSQLGTYGTGIVVPSYSFSYTPGTSITPPYLSTITNTVGTGESYTVNINSNQPLNGPPNNVSFGTTGVLNSVTATGLGYAWTFNYDSAGNGNLTEVQFPQGGSLSWAYSGFLYLGQRELWQVSNRYLQSSSQQQSPYPYTLTWPDSGNTVALHTGVALDDSTSNTEKYWSFNPSGQSFAGLVSELQYRSAPGVTTPLPRDESYTWMLDPTGNAVVGTVTTTLDAGQTYAKTTQTTQTQDGYGNVLTSSITDYGTQSTRSYTNTYLNGTTYTALHIYDRLATSVMTSNGNLTLVSNQYDTSAVQWPGNVNQATPREQDWQNYSPSFTHRGNLTVANSPGRTINTVYDSTGTVVSQNDNNGHSVSIATSDSTNYTLPDTLNPNGSTTLQTQASYNPNLTPASVAGPGQTLYDPNSTSGTAGYTSYDTHGRVAYTLAPSQSWSSANGARTDYAYTYATTGWTVKATTTNADSTTHWTLSTLDGLGRTASVQTGATNVATSEVDTTYAPCACSPLGKMSKQSQPYAPPNSAPPGTTYTYDALGRTVNVLLPDGASHTQYIYQGNATTVIDPAGKWKQYLSDAYGNLVTVLEPDPTANPMPGAPNPPPAYPVTTAPPGMLLTSYTYDQLNHLTQVSMPRNVAGAMKTQTRTFVYSPTTLRLTSATNPETGTVNYTYNADGTLATKQDANNNTETYTYDSYGRLTGIPDRQQTFTYDTCPTGATGCINAPGQLMQTAFASGVGPNGLSFQYNYSYTPAGKVSGKTLAVQSSLKPANQWGQPSANTIAANYTYDSQGALISTAFPILYYPNYTLTYSRDSMERPTTLTDNLHPVAWATGVTYNMANQMLYDGVQTWTYNSLLQATSVVGTGMSMTYNYSPNQNNGQITSSVDAGVTPHETITYTYDALKRLVEADGLNWTEHYVYDGYSNLTQMNPTGGAPTLNVSVQTDANGVPTNRITASGVFYDSNGNLTQGFSGQHFTYDVANRIMVATAGSQSMNYAYDSVNRRVYSRDSSGNETVYLYGVDGKKLASYTLSFTLSNGYYSMLLSPQNYNVYFAGRLISAEGNPVRTDRLGSVRAGGPGGLGAQALYPYGAEYSTTANDREKYATYTRDSSTGLDYAMNRYYSSQWGRFLSPDPGGRSAKGTSPQTWNRYTYSSSDPINRMDPSGLVDEECTADTCGGDGGDDGGDGGPCGDGTNNCQCSDGSMSPGCITVTRPMPTDPEPGDPPVDPPAPQPVQPPQDQSDSPNACFLELKYRAVGGGIPANHAYLWMGTAMGSIVTLEGFPQSPSYPWGNLTARTSPNGLLGTNATGDGEWGPELESTNLGNGGIIDPALCSQINSILLAETRYNLNQVGYSGLGPNSNSLANFFLHAGGLGWVFTAPPLTVGWDAPIYAPPLPNKYHRYRPQ